MEENKVLSIALYIGLPILIHVLLAFLGGKNRRVLMCGLVVILVSVAALFWMNYLDSWRSSVQEECAVRYNTDVPEGFRGERECETNSVEERIKKNGEITKVGVIVADAAATIFAIWFLVAGKGEAEMELEKGTKARTGSSRTSVQAGKVVAKKAKAGGKKTAKRK